MAPSRHADEGGQLQLLEADRVDEEEECFESIDKRKPRPLPLSSHLSHSLISSARARFPPYHPGLVAWSVLQSPVVRLRRIASVTVSIRRFAFLGFFWGENFHPNWCCLEAKLMRFELGLGTCLVFVISLRARGRVVGFCASSDISPKFLVLWESTSVAWRPRFVGFSIPHA